MQPDLETLALPELADRLEDLDGRRTPIGWSPDDAVVRAGIERRILALIALDRDPLRPGIACRMDIRLASKEQLKPAVALEIGPGGVLVETSGRWVIGTHVDLHVSSRDADEHGLRVRGIIDRVEGNSVSISLAAQPTEAHERRLRRFVLELLRRRVH